MKLSLLTFLTFCIYNSSSFAQTNMNIDSAEIKPAKITQFEPIWGGIYRPGTAFIDNFTSLFQKKRFDKVLHSDVKVNITNITKNIPYRLYLKNLTTNHYVFISDRWAYDNCDSSASMFIDQKLFKFPLKYQITVVPRAKLGGKIFTDLNDKKATCKNIFGKTLAYFSLDEDRRVRKNFIGLFAFLAYTAIVIWISRRARSLNATKQKEKAQLQLDAVRSQLNPHFLFNALAGIQTLMNTSQIEQANRYLTRFSRLTRAVLNSADLISLNEECKLLDDYLQMEQLRFNFKYKITTDTDLDMDNIEIPSMLLQPFIENAVKHGIASLGNHGQININIYKTDGDLILEIEDNGRGFEISKSFEGLGFNLSTKRISLLNKIYRNDQILLNMQSQPGKTVVGLTLTKWI